MLRFLPSFILVTAMVASGAARALGPECDTPKEGSTLQESCFLQGGLDELDAELNRTYKELLLRWNSKDFRLERTELIAAQRAWISFRDKTCSFEQAVHGGINSISFSRCVVRLTTDRVEYLKELLG